MMRFDTRTLMKCAGALVLLGGTALTPLVAEAAGPKDTLRIAKYANAPALGDVFTNSGSPSQYGTARCSTSSPWSTKAGS